MSQTTEHPSPERRKVLARRRTAMLATALSIALVAAACGKKDELKGDVVKEGLGCVTNEVPRRTDAPKVEAGTKVGKKVGTKDLIAGKGKAAGAECYLSLDIVSATAKDGKVFASTFETGHPITVQSASTGLVAGLDTGIKGMKVGSRRQVTVPAAQGYGKDGNPAQGVGKDADLVFVVDLIAATATPVYCSAITDLPEEKDGKPIEGKPAKDDVKMPVKVPETKVETRDIKVGTGKAVPKDAFVTVKYFGISCLTGRQFDSSWDRGPDETLKATIGSATDPTGQFNGVINGWSDGLVGAKVGGIRQMNIPYQLAYGSTARDADIGAYATLVFVVEIVDVSSKPPATTTTAPVTTTAAPSDATTTTAAAGDATTTTAGDTATTTTTAETTTTAKG